jgi:uncharacterized protein (DUF58 family)
MERYGMPWARYLLFVGGALLALLFFSDAYFPKLPVEVKADSEHPVIRIHSDRKWPERVVFDTNRPTIVPAQSTTTVAIAPAPRDAGTASKRPVRDAYAALNSADQKQAQVSDPNKPEKKAQRKRRIVARHVAPPIRLAQQPQFGFFGNSWNSTW